jgi:pseudouridine kinase
LSDKKRILCLGGAALDRRYYAAGPLIGGSSNPVTSRRAFGGVARNVAENLARLGDDVGLISIIGEDEAAESLLRDLGRLEIDVSQMVRTDRRATAEYAAVIGATGELAIGLADMAIMELLTVEHLERVSPCLAAASIVFADCNLGADFLAALAVRSAGGKFVLAVDAVSVAKARRLPRRLDGIDLLFLNRDEADAYLGDAASSPATSAAALRACGAGAVILTLGEDGAILATADGVTRVEAVEARLVDVTGAGDAMIGGTLHARARGEPLGDAVRVGALLAAITVEHGASVHPELSQSLLAAESRRIAEAAASRALSRENGDGSTQDERMTPRWRRDET